MSNTPSIPLATPAQNVARYGPRCLPSVSEASSHYQDQRIADGYLTLGDLINLLYNIPNHRTPVLADTQVAFGTPHAYRGYYVDLAFAPTVEPQRVADLLIVATQAVGTEYQAWKGGGHIRMNLNTPVWLAHRGEVGRYLTGATPSTAGLILTTAFE